MWHELELEEEEWRVVLGALEGEYARLMNLQWGWKEESSTYQRYEREIVQVVDIIQKVQKEIEE